MAETTGRRIRHFASEGPADLLWAFWPGRVWRHSPAFGLILSDGGWLRAVPGVGLAAPAAAFGLGLWRGGFRPAEQVTYSYSLAWLVVFVAVALVGCGVGAWLWLGFVVGDLTLFDHPPLGFFGQSVSVWDRISQALVPQLISYLLLAVLVVGTPLVALLARGTVAGLLSRADPGVRTALAAAAGGVAAGLQGGLWTQSFPLLVRPLWTWRERLDNPDAAAIVPVQEHPWLFGVVAGVAAATWALVAFRGLARITGRRYQPVAAGPSARAPDPDGAAGATGRGVARAVLASVLRAGVTTLLLAGLVPDAGRGAVVFAVLAAVFYAQLAVLPRLAPVRWWTTAVPLGVRLVAAAALAWTVAYLIGRTTYRTVLGEIRIVTAHDFAPLLYAAVAATAAMALLLPPPAAETPRAGGDTRDGGDSGDSKDSSESGDSSDSGQEHR